MRGRPRRRRDRELDPAGELQRLDQVRNAMIERVDRMISQPAEAPAAHPQSRVRRRRRQKD